jgi:ADP-heptose:LPS heptosyltransferase
MELFIISGEAEPADILAGCGQPWRCLPLNTLLGRLAQCRLFIGHDSGVGHLAAVAGIPCLLLFGPTDPAVWAPPHQKVKVIRQGSALSDISVEQVYEAAAAMLREPR